MRGCRALVFDPAEHLLLVRHSYGPAEWTLPGGGIARGEDACAAARREVREETGCRLAEACGLGLAADAAAMGLHEVELVAGWTSDPAVPDGREIMAAAFFALDALPAPMAPRLAAALPGYVTRARAARPLASG